MRSRSIVLCATFLLTASVLAATVHGATPAAKPAPRAAASSAGSGPDPYLWLENVTGKQALAWVDKHDRVSNHALAEDSASRAMAARFLAILDSKEKIPYVDKVGESYYNFWRDARHERGVWRRTTLAEYRKAEPAWETVLDLDSLGRVEKENWVWKGANALPPDYSRCLVSLSRGGADAVVIREFDLGTRAFVAGGFTLPEAKSDVGWRNRDDVYVGTDCGPGSMTTSGYARLVRLWKRGTPITAATLVYEGDSTDVGTFVGHDFTPGFERDLVFRATTFFTSQQFLLRDGKTVQIDKPDDATAGFYHEWLLIQLRTAWTVGGKTWPAGALLAAPLEGFLAGARDFQLLFEPTERKSLSGYSNTLTGLLVNELDNVRSRIYVLKPEGGRWTRTPVPGVPEFGNSEATPVDGYRSDDYFLKSTDFLTPSSLYLGTAGGGPPERLKQSPAFFDPKGLEVSQHEAISKDGTRIPYFQVARKDLEADGNTPALLTGYGGFEVSEVPHYSGVQGAGWLEKGGVLALANIRGGGEFGPQWHQAALKANRPRAYEDFIAVGEDLVRRHVTSAKHLGCMGGSNGGLLVGNMLTMRPDLFAAIVCESPLLDMRRYSKLLAGASWMGEYGDPDRPAEWKFIRAFSPYHNLRKDAAYPPTLFTSSTRDDRVHPGHARKMVARMEAQGHDVLYYENVEGGHAGAADNRQYAFMSALAYTFLWQHLR